MVERSNHRYLCLALVAVQIKHYHFANDTYIVVGRMIESELVDDIRMMMYDGTWHIADNIWDNNNGMTHHT